MKKHIYVNLKRFDVSKQEGGVNAISSMEDWSNHILQATSDKLRSINDMVETCFFWPESHIILAAKNRKSGHSSLVGCQGIASVDIEEGRNFGAMTTLRSAKAMAESGCEAVIIGHSEERQYLISIINECLSNIGLGVSLSKSQLNNSLNGIFRKMIDIAQAAGLKVLFCVGEDEDQRHNTIKELATQLDPLKNADHNKTVIAYEPIWAIGPGKKTPSFSEIQEVAVNIKAIFPQVPLLYGGGLKKDNAQMISSIPEIDGGLIALTNFTESIGFYPDSFLEIVDEYLKTIM